jgi:hypothetical protein
MKNYTPKGSRNLFNAGKIVSLLGKMRYSEKVHLLSYICIVFHFYTLSGCKDTKMEAILPKPLHGI